MTGSSGPTGGSASSEPARTAALARVRTHDARVAAAMEDDGRLVDAARVYEQIGDHAQAAMLRLEHARTIADEHQRLAVLREGCARNPGDTPQGRALHKSLARTLQTMAEGMADGVRRRGLLIEAAQALAAADEGEQAGDLFHELGLLARAADAYEAAGAIGKLEVTLEVLDRRERALESLRRLEADIEEAWIDGRRRIARALLAEQASRTLAHADAALRVGFADKLAQLDLARPSLRRSLWRWRVGGREGTTTVIVDDRLVFGRAPDADVVLSGPSLSRHHALLRWVLVGDTSQLVAEDLGSRGGTFVDGVALAPAIAHVIDGPTELAFADAPAITVTPFDAEHGLSAALLRLPRGPADTLCLCPHGGRLALAEDLRPPLRVSSDGGWLVVDAAEDARLWIGERPLGPRGRVELLVGDRLLLAPAPSGDSTIELELIG